MDKLHIDTENGRIYLTDEQQASLRNQMRMMEAYDVICAFDCPVVDELSDNILLEIGEKLEDALYSDNGEIEWDVLSEYADVLQLNEDEEEDDDEDSYFSEEDYEEAVEQLDNLDLDDTDYNYYKECMDDLYYADEISIKNGEVGYKDFKSILKDARRCNR